MIGRLSGSIIWKGERYVIVDVGGVGYKVFIPITLLQKHSVNEQAVFWIHTHVKEDSLELYGFKFPSELEFFEMLIGISGIGPRSALGVMALAPVDTIKKAIASGDTSYLTKVSGIGRKIAEKIVMELKDKLGFGMVSESNPLLQHDTDVLDALLALGYEPRDAREALSKIPDTTSGREARLKSAIKMLGK
jgi:Holliday junction DNA helicase RuvA